MFIGFKVCPKKTFDKFPTNTHKVALTIYNYNKLKNRMQMALKEYLENYKPPQVKRGYFYGTEKREAEWEQVLKALEEGYKDTTALVNWLVNECGWDGITPKSITNRINEQKKHIK